MHHRCSIDCNQRDTLFLIYFRSQIVLAENPALINQSNTSLSKSHLTVDDFQAVKKLEKTPISSSKNRPRIISNHYHHTYEFSRNTSSAEVAEIETVL